MVSKKKCFAPEASVLAIKMSDINMVTRPLLFFVEIGFKMADLAAILFLKNMKKIVKIHIMSTVPGMARF